jgi:hypothetical protein
MSLRLKQRLVNRQTTQVIEMKAPIMRGEQSEHNKLAAGPFFEVLTAEELAERWRVPESWVREQTRSRCTDPIPHVRLGRYVRFSWGSPELNSWWARRLSKATQFA